MVQQITQPNLPPHLKLSDGGTWYETGSYLRNLLLNRPGQETPDFIVHGLSEQQVHELTKQQEDVCKIRVIDDIHELKNIQGLSIDTLYRNVETNKIFDPARGLQDLQNRFVRVAPEMILETPDLMMRACRVAAELDFTLHTETWFELYKHARLIKYVSAANLGAEILKIIRLPKPSVCFKLLQETRLLEFLIPELAACSTVIQSKRIGVHNVFDHIMYALDASDNTDLIRFSVLFHDIAKPQTIQLGDDGKIHFFKHEVLGSQVAKRYMKYWGLDKKLSSDVGTLVLHHMFDAAPNLNERAVKRLINKVGKDLIYDLLRVRVADRLGSSHSISMKKILLLKKKIDAVMHDES